MVSGESFQGFFPGRFSLSHIPTGFNILQPTSSISFLHCQVSRFYTAAAWHLPEPRGHSAK